MAALVAWAPPAAAGEFDGWYFPPAGEALDRQSRKAPADVGLDPKVVAGLKGKATRWALWRHGHLVHVEGDWNATLDVASLRKTWHALTVGAAIGQGRVPSVHQRLAAWQPDLTGRDAAATWWHVVTQSTAFDFPSDTHRDLGDPRPGEVWTYSDKNPVRLCNALAKVYGKADYRDKYDDVLKAAYFDAIGMRGWSTKAIDDGIRLVLDLEDMGRLGLLVLARGSWDGKPVVPRWFVEELERKQTHGMRPVYDGPDDGNVGQGWFHENRAKFPEAPYGFMTWVNADGNLYPGADRAWAYAAGRGGTRVLWNHKNGIVYAAVGVTERPTESAIAQTIEANLTGPNPLVKAPAPAADPKDAKEAKPVGRWDRFEAAVNNPKKYADPYRDVTLDVTYTRPDGTAVKFWGFHDGGAGWKLRFMPDQLGAWKYEATFSDGSPGASGTFRCVASGLPGMVSVYEPNPVWFGFRDGHGGSPFLMRSFHVGDRFFAANWPADKRAAFLDWAEGQGYNTLSVASFFLNRDVEGRGKGWDTPKLWPLNAAEYREAEAILDDLARRRMAVFPFAGFFGRDADLPKDPKDQERYVRYALARFGPYWNVLFNVGGPEPLLKNKTYLSADDVHRLGRLVRRLDVFGHPLTVHNPTGDDAFKDADWLTFGTLQGPKTTDRAELSAGLLKNHHPKKPLYAQETLWSGNVNHIRRFGGRDYTDDDLRKNAFVLTASVAATNFADNAGDSSTGFSGTLDPADRKQARHDAVRRVWDVFETVPHHRMRPRQDLVDAGYCLADEGNDYLVYLESPGKVNVKVRGGPYRVEWVDARKPTDRRAGGTTADGRGLAPPAGGDDWLLRLTAAPPAGVGAARPAWPVPDWVAAKPEDVGCSAPALAAYGEWLDKKAGAKPYGTVIVRHGKVAYERYGGGGAADSAWEIGSIRKPVASALLGMALAEGKLKLDTVAADVWPEIHTLTKADKDKGIRVRHLATATSGWMTAAKPGEEWRYHNLAFTACHAVIGRAYGAKDDKVAPLVEARVRDPIGAKSWKVYHYAEGWDKTPGPKLAIDSTLRDLARYGYLWLRKGEWDGKQLIPADYVAAATRNQVADLKAHYGYLWFTNDGRELLPDAPADAFYHTGSGRPDRKTVLFVCPSLDLVALVGTDKTVYDIDSAKAVNEWAGRVLPAVKDAGR